MLRRLANAMYGQSMQAMARIQGYEFAVVKDVEDPWKLGRIRVQFPWQKGDTLSGWIIPGNAPLGDGIGSTFAIPNLEDVVLVIFYNGLIGGGAYLGGLWTPGGGSGADRFEARKSLIKGGSRTAPSAFKLTDTPDTSPSDYSEPAAGAWITNDPTRRVNEVRGLGGWRLLVEEFKRRLRFFSHPTTPFTLKIEHFDGDSVQPPESNTHRLKITSPGGAVIAIEEQNNSFKVEISSQGNKLLLENGNGTNKVSLKDSQGGELVLDAASGIRHLADGAGNKVEIAQSGQVAVNASSQVTVNGPMIMVGPNGQVFLAGGGRPVALVGDQVLVAGMSGVIVGPGSARVSSG